MSEALPPPRFLFLAVNSRCNLRCVHCRYWQSHGAARPMESKIRFIDEFAGFAADPAVVTCGGEPTLDYDEYLQIATACRARGVKCLSVINGTGLDRDGRAAELVERGPTEITVSIDSPDAAEHDAVRGVAGAHAAAVHGLRLLLQARGARLAPRLYVMAVVSERNYRTLERFYDWALHELGADKLKLNFLQPTFGGGANRDPYFAAHFIRDPSAALRIIEACNERYKLQLSPNWLSVVRVYLEAVARNGNAIRGWEHRPGTPVAICSSYERNIVIDENDVARLCHNTKFPGVPLKPGGLRAFWENANWRPAMAACRMYCGISHSTRNVPATMR